MKVVYQREGLRVIVTDPKVYGDVTTARRRVMVTGFKGHGLVGHLAVTQLVESLKCRRMGVILPKVAPEIVFSAEGGIEAAMQLYGCRIGDLGVMVLVNHDVPDERERSVYAEAVVEWLKREGFDEMVLIGGLDKRFGKGDARLCWLSVGGYRGSLPEPRMDPGLLIVGPLALFLLYADLYQLPTLVLLPYTEPTQIDHKAAAVALEKLSELYGVSIDVKPLYEKAKELEEQAKMEEQLRREMMEMMAQGHAERVYM